MARTLLLYGTLTLLAGLSLWLLLSIRATLDVEDRGPPRGPALQLRAFSATYLDADGQQRYALQAPYLIQLPGEQGIEVQSPTLEIFAPDGRRDWLIESEQGWLSPDQRLVVLRDAVSAERAATATRPPLSMRTRDLIYRRALHQLSTDASVSLETPNSRLQGVGLRADLDDGRYSLLWNVRGEYAPPPS